MRTHGRFGRLFVLFVRHDIPIFKTEAYTITLWPIHHIPLVLLMPEFVVSIHLLSKTSDRHPTTYQDAQLNRNTRQERSAAENHSDN